MIHVDRHTERPRCDPRFQGCHYTTTRRDKSPTAVQSHAREEFVTCRSDARELLQIGLYGIEPLFEDISSGNDIGVSAGGR